SDEVDQEDAGSHVDPAQEVACERPAEHGAALRRQDVESSLSHQQAAAQERKARAVRQDAVAEHGGEQRQLHELDHRVQAYRGRLMMDRSKSSFRSMGSSRPAETRTVPDFTPRSIRSLAGMSRCDVSAGYEMVVSTPARLAAKRTRRNLEIIAWTACCPPARSNASIPPAPSGSKRCAIGREGAPSSRGWCTASTPGSRARQRAISNALSLWRRILRCSVRRPRRASHASNGPRTDPMWARCSRARSISSRLPTSTPAMRSE